MRDKIRYGLFFVREGADKRQQLSEGGHQSDVHKLAIKALWVMEEFAQERGIFYRLHKDSATGMEIWELHAGGNAAFEPPDRRLAHVNWDDEELRFDRPEERELFLRCNCVVSCADDPRTACSLSGTRHVHPRDRRGEFGPCRAHPDAPGDL